MFVVAITESIQVTLEVGPWLFRLEARPQGNFPDVRSVIPVPGPKATRLLLGAEDARTLVQALPRLSGRNEKCSHVNLVLGSTIAVRAGEEADQPQEVVLAGSRVEGPPVQVACDRRLLLRALRLGFQEIVAVAPDRPLLFQDGKRTYVWMPLGPEAAGASRRAASPGETAAGEPAPAPRIEPGTNGISPAGPPTDMRQASPPSGNETLGPIAEAEALRQQLQDALARTSRLIASLKQFRRHSRAVQAAVTSLRRLRQLGE